MNWSQIPASKPSKPVPSCNRSRPGGNAVHNKRTVHTGNSSMAVVRLRCRRQRQLRRPRLLRRETTSPTKRSRCWTLQLPLRRWLLPRQGRSESFSWDSPTTGCALSILFPSPLFSPAAILRSRAAFSLATVVALPNRAMASRIAFGLPRSWTNKAHGVIDSARAVRRPRITGYSHPVKGWVILPCGIWGPL